MYEYRPRSDFYMTLENEAEAEVDCNGTEKIEDTNCCLICGRVYGEGRQYCMSCGEELTPFSNIEPIEA